MLRFGELFTNLSCFIFLEEDLKGMKWIDSETESNNEEIGEKISA